MNVKLVFRHALADRRIVPEDLYRDTSTDLNRRDFIIDVRVSRLVDQLRLVAAPVITFTLHNTV